MEILKRFVSQTSNQSGATAIAVASLVTLRPRLVPNKSAPKPPTRMLASTLLSPIRSLALPINPPADYPLLTL